MTATNIEPTALDLRDIADEYGQLELLADNGVTGEHRATLWLLPGDVERAIETNGLTVFEADDTAGFAAALVEYGIEAS